MTARLNGWHAKLSYYRYESRRTVSPPLVLLSTAIVLGLPTLGIVETRNSAFRDELDVLDTFLNSPLTLIFPLVVVVLGCSRLAQDMTDRHIVSIRTRVDIRTAMGARLANAVLTSGGVFFLTGLLATFVATVLWPVIGNPGVDPAVYGDSIEPLASRFTYGDLIGKSESPVLYGVVYSILVAVAACAYAALGFSCLLMLPNRFVAMLTPFALYLGSSILASLLGAPHLAPMFSAFPFGLKPTPAAIAVIPTLVVACVSGALLWVQFRRLHTNPRLL